ncbi:hypothetical protein SNOG_03021 [Parastagonospora nodorum SN15]|uniref:Uncharacterized protein n=1 Tax=Phaeosphaeria nodorum (strain SN15 / ATCC MYA-4574 / FGSC 10173) TaxID=321614 RepID=Q0UYZ3_PHANO|nr:hypothetical protein SNOG_03021 [Parastagonospora nodorum SN15]EAT89752.1 hypothetical protein SNOG_03021 [Parastagonospora nodorum SN15]
MDANDTLSQPTPSGRSSWSKEAAFACATILLMALGLAIKYRRELRDLVHSKNRPWLRWFRNGN